LVTDVVMPGRSGLELAQILTAQDTALSVVVISGFVPDGSAGMHTSWRMLPKPFRPSRLVTVVDEMTSA
jgi:FixJ family two-component response regulator